MNSNYKQIKDIETQEIADQVLIRKTMINECAGQLYKSILADEVILLQERLNNRNNYQPTQEELLAFRDKTNFPLHLCKRALLEANGDQMSAIEIMRSYGTPNDKRNLAEEVQTLQTKYDLLFRTVSQIVATVYIDQNQSSTVAQLKPHIEQFVQILKEKDIDIFEGKE